MNERTQIKILRGLETLAGAGVIAVGANETKDVAIPLYIGGGYLVLEGLTNLISKDYDFLGNKAKELFYHIKNKIGNKK